MSRHPVDVPPAQVDPRLARVLRRLREERGLSQERFGGVVGLTANTVGGYELGRAGPSWVTVVQIAEALDLSLVELGKMVEVESR